jgi:hypothetical protein
VTLLQAVSFSPQQHFTPQQVSDAHRGGAPRSQQLVVAVSSTGTQTYQLGTWPAGGRDPRSLPPGTALPNASPSRDHFQGGDELALGHADVEHRHLAEVTPRSEPHSTRSSTHRGGATKDESAAHHARRSDVSLPPRAAKGSGNGSGTAPGVRSGWPSGRPLQPDSGIVSGTRQRRHSGPLGCHQDSSNDRSSSRSSADHPASQRPANSSEGSRHPTAVVQSEGSRGVKAPTPVQAIRGSL